MMNRWAVRRLYRLADRMSTLAEVVRQADRPGHLTEVKHRHLRHLMELNQIRDTWADAYKPSRRAKVPRPPCSCDGPNFWQMRAMFPRNR